MDTKGYAWFKHIKHAKNRRAWEAESDKITTLLFGKRKNVAMELQDFQRYADLTGQQTSIHTWDKESICLFETVGEGKRCHLLMHNVTRKEQTFLHFHLVTDMSALNSNNIEERFRYFW